MIYDLARDTYKAIYGKEPAHIPYQGASHAPFQGMDVDLVKSLVNISEVNKYLQAWKKENTPKNLSLYSFVSGRKYVVGIYKESLYAIQDIETGTLSYTNTVKPVIPKPGYADTLRLAVVRTKEHIDDYKEHTLVEHVSGKATGFITSSFRVDKSTEMFYNSIANGCISWTVQSCLDIPDILPIHKVNLL